MGTSLIFLKKRSCAREGNSIKKIPKNKEVKCRNLKFKTNNSVFSAKV